jgi:hypothetical protein
MTPKEKAVDIFYKYYQATKDHNIAKECALIAVDELIKEVYNISHQYTAKYDEETKFYNYTESKELKFWIEVKKQIEAL